MKKNTIFKSMSAALAAAMLVTSFSVPAMAETTTKTGTGLVQKFTYNVSVVASLNEDGAITSISYDEAQTFGDQNLGYATTAMEGIQSQIQEKGSISSVNDVDVVTGATLTSNGIRQAIAEITGEEFDLTAANGSLVMGKNGEVGLEDAMKKAENFLKLSSLEKDADGNYITTGQSEAWMAYYNLYQQGSAMLEDESATAYDKAIVEAEMNDALLALKKETGSDRGGASGGGDGERTPAGDSTALSALIEQAKALTETDYTAESWKVLQDELAEAESLIAIGKSTQTALDAQQADLQTALDALEKAPAPVTPVTVTAKKQTLKVTVKTVSLKASSLKKAKKTVKCITVKNAKTTLSYTKSSGSKKLTVSKKTGKITVKKGTKKGSYTIKVKVAAKATKTYQKASKTVTVKVKVK